MFKAFLFDYDGVMTAGAADNLPALRLAHNLEVSEEDTAKWIISIWDGYSTGKLNTDEVWQSIARQYGKPIEQSLRNIWFTWDELRPLPQMSVLVESLKAKKYPVGVISNTIPPSAELIRNHGGYDLFSFAVLSPEAGARKPNPQIFKAAMTHMPGIQPHEVVYLDDREHLVDAARELGFYGIHVVNHEEAIKQVLEIVGSYELLHTVE